MVTQGQESCLHTPVWGVEGFNISTSKVIYQHFILFQNPYLFISFHFLSFLSNDTFAGGGGGTYHRKAAHQGL